MKTQTTSVGTYLLWLILAVSVPLLLFTTGTVWRIQNTQLRQQESALLEQARDAARPVDEMFLRLEEGMSGLAGSTALRRGDLDGFELEMRGFTNRFAASPLFLAASSGETLLRIGPAQPPDAFEDRPVRQAMLAALRTTVPGISNLLAPDDPTQRAVAISVPAFRAGETSPAYALTVMLDSARLARLADLPPAHPDGLVLTVHDRNGVTVASSLNPDRHIGETARPDLREAVARGGSGLLADAARLEGVAAIRPSAWRRSAGSSSSRHCLRPLSAPRCGTT
jgi:hypothetical protein